ncbi:hypothetical protein AgCh_022519 [Apium graveolens]
MSCAIEFRDAFLVYSTSDQGFKEYVPSPDDWERVVEYCREDRDANKERNESSEISSSDASFMNEQRETPKGINDYESFIRESGAWWKGNSAKFPILSQMASDILSIHISTVASKSTFSAGSRVIEPHRSCLKPETVEVLLCGADWVRELYGLKKSKEDEDKEIVIHLD